MRGVDQIISHNTNLFWKGFGDDTSHLQPKFTVEMIWVRSATFRTPTAGMLGNDILAFCTVNWQSGHYGLRSCPGFHSSHKPHLQWCCQFLGAARSNNYTSSRNFIRNRLFYHCLPAVDDDCLQCLLINTSLDLAPKETYVTDMLTGV